MKSLQGEFINGYQILDDFHSAGNCEWTLGMKSGKKYFIKKYNKYILTDAGSLEDRKRKKEEFECYFRRTSKITKILNHLSPEGGNLIVARDLFIYEKHLYKVTEWIDNESLQWDEVYSLPLGYRFLFLRTLTHSVKLLHDISIVHCDLKPDNVLIKKTDAGALVAKLIDFDDSFQSGDPPAPDDTVGTCEYYSPELALYINGLEYSPPIRPNDISTKSDIFALGILFSLILTGRWPQFDNDDDIPFISVLDGKQPKFCSSNLPARIMNLLNSMLDVDFQKRPNIDQVFEVLKFPFDTKSTTPSIVTNLKGDLARRG